MASVPSCGADNGMASQQLVDAVHLAVTQLNQDGSTGSGEPAAKRIKTDDSDIGMEQSIKQILFNINKAICLRLDSMENKLEVINVRSKYLEEKVEQIFMHMKLSTNSVVVPTTPIKSGVGANRKSGAVIVGLPQEKSPGLAEQINSLAQGTVQTKGGRIIAIEAEGPPDQGMAGFDQSMQNLGPNVQLITLNTEEDFPQGTWLGDETNPEMRVRVPITPSDLLHVHSNCRAPERMALALLDYLFDRETQASSNLSGMGKHGKKQLDPLMIYGIRCHLIHRFAISEQDWHRIKQNVDSKCRTAFRRKTKGLPLTVKAFRGKAPPTYVHVGMHEMHEMSQSDDSLQHDDTELHITQEVDLTHAGVMHSGAEIIQSAAGEIQVLHATPEQVAQLQQAHQIQILQGDATQVMLQDGQESYQVAVSMAPQHPDGGIQVITAETGEAVHINTDTDMQEIETEVHTDVEQ